MSSLIILLNLLERIRDDQRVPRRIIRDGQNPFQMATDDQFMDLYRFPKALCLMLIDELVPFLPKTRRRHAILSHVMVLSALRFFATGSFQRSVGQDGFSTLSQSSVSRCVQVVATALNKISHKHIRFPEPENFPALKIKFLNKYQFPGVIGLIDGTHIKISARKRETEHVNQSLNGGHSKNMMIICDVDGIILATNAQFGVTSHDSYVWSQSQACRNLEQIYDAGERNFWLLGDSCYPLQPWLMTPISTTTSISEERYNLAHKSTRAVVKRCIGILKSRFRCLSREKGLFYSPSKAGLIINACVVLHNYLVRQKVPFQEISLDDSIESEDYVTYSANILACNNVLNIAKRQRSQIVQDAFTNNIKT